MLSRAMSVSANPFIPEILTPEEVANLLRISRKTVMTYARRGDIPSFKVGKYVRFRREDVQRYVDQASAHPS